jgi:hypothetical protein
MGRRLLPSTLKSFTKLHNRRVETLLPFKMTLDERLFFLISSSMLPVEQIP